jgi:Tol biopolymer transport system component
VDAYELVRPLGSGGMGEVWLATDAHLRRKVALKLLPTDLTRDPTRIARFQQEARAASALSHPNVCVIHALGATTDGQHYIAMEYVDGRTLRGRLLHERLPLREALDIAIQIASALAAAHASGIVHRDIKPENVMLRPDGFVKVLDFGLAKLTAVGGADAAHSTQTAFRTEAGSVVGTVAYMSPEQARGQPVDARADIWSLGVLLYEMVAGRGPFTGQSSSDVLAAILQNEPTPLARFEPETPPELQRIVGKALRKDRAQRYQTVQDLLLDLQALREEIQSQARTGSAAGTAAATKPVGSDSGQALAVVPPYSRRLALAVTAAVLVIGAGVGFWAWTTMRPAPTPAVATGEPVQRNLTRLTFDPGLQTDVTWSRDGTRIAYAADRSGNFDIWTQPVAGGDPVQVTKSPAADTQPSWSPDGRNLVFRSERDGGGLFVVHALGGPERRITSFGVDPQWSPDGTEILFARDRVRRTHMYLVSPEGAEPPREILKDFLHTGWWDWFGFHPDGRISLSGNHRERGFGFFTVSPADGRLTMSSIEAGLPLRVGIQGDRVLRFQWNDTGDALFAEATRNEVRNVWKVAVEPRTLAWRSAERLTTGQGADTAAALSPDGARVAFTTQREAVRLWVFPFDPVAGRVTGSGRPVSPEEGGAGDARLSPDGRTVAYSLTRPGAGRTDLWLTNIDSGASELLARDALGPCWSLDGKTIAYNLFRSDRPPRGEFALAIRELGGAERLLTGWSTESVLYPQDWAEDGRAILAVYLSPLFTGRARLELRSIANPHAADPARVLVEDARARIWQGRYSPDARWLSFVVERIDDPLQQLQLAVAPARGAPRAEWIPIATDHDTPDKPRWSPDGRTIYFLSRHESSVFNLWGRRFDPERGRPVGEPFRVTHFENPGFMIWPELARGSEIDISRRHALLTMATVTGNIWMLDSVNK